MPEGMRKPRVTELVTRGSSRKPTIEKGETIVRTPDVGAMSSSDGRIEELTAQLSELSGYFATLPRPVDFDVAASCSATFFDTEYIPSRLRLREKSVFG